MDTTIIALKNLYVALGGTAADVADITLIPDMINAIAGAVVQLPAVDYHDAGKILGVSSDGKIVAAANPIPAVTASDNGKVMTVVNGAWDKAALPG